jgi:hypothetical protein
MSAALEPAFERDVRTLVNTSFAPKDWKADNAFEANVVMGCATMDALELPRIRLYEYAWVYDAHVHLTAECQRVLCARAGYDLEVVSESAEASTVRIRYRGGSWKQVTFTMAQAVAAKLTTKDVWSKYPVHMLTARACTHAISLYAPEVKAGIARADVDWDDSDAELGAGERPTIPPAEREPEIDPDALADILVQVHRLPPAQLEWFAHTWKDDLRCPNLHRGRWLTRAHDRLARYMILDAEEQAVAFGKRLDDAVAEAIPAEIHDEAPEAVDHTADSGTWADDLDPGRPF